MKKPDSDRPGSRRQLAVALEYTGDGAPRVTAKGAGQIAETILKTAAEHDIPLRSDHELVELLAQLPLNTEIPESLYRVVAEVIAFAYMIKGLTPADTAKKRKQP